MVKTTGQLRFVSQYLAALGFNQTATRLYLALVENGSMTLLAASRATGVERTKLYRIIEDLQAKGLIEETQEYKRRAIRAVDINKIELLVKEREIQNAFLTSSFPTFSETIKSLTGSFPGQKVVYYRGVDGIRQMSWNILQTKGMYRTYSFRYWNDLLGDAFTARLGDELGKLNVPVHDLYSDEYVKFIIEWFRTGHKLPPGDWHNWESRYIPSKTLTIDLNIDIYNDTVAYYYWRGKEIFGAEIVNEKIASFQKQVHDILWKMGKKRPEVDWPHPETNLKAIRVAIKKEGVQGVSAQRFTKGKLPHSVPSLIKKSS